MQASGVCEKDAPACWDNDLFASECFLADDERDVLVCPAGRELSFSGEYQYGSGRYRLCSAHGCASCSFRDQCQYLDYIATPIWNYLSTRPHIKCIVLCYGIPSRITYQTNYDMSVDAALALLGNPGVPDAQGQFVRHWGLNSTNPYCGKNTDKRRIVPGRLHL